MAIRMVTKSRKGYSGDILALCNPVESWSPRYKFDVIRDIENGTHNYFVDLDGLRVSVTVLSDRGNKRLIAKDNNSINNALEELENC